MDDGGGFNGPWEIWRIGPDGTGLARVATRPASVTANSSRTYSPNGLGSPSRASSGPTDSIWTMNADGSGQTRLTDIAVGHPIMVAGRDQNRIWAADGSSGIWVMNADGSDKRLLTTHYGGGYPDWRPVLGFARPKAAKPMYVQLVPAYRDCTSTTREHAPPLSHPSCPPNQMSSRLTIGTPDANAPVGERSRVREADAGRRGAHQHRQRQQANVTIDVSVADVRRQSDLADYTGELALDLSLKITDRDNAPAPSGANAGSGPGIHFRVPIPCTATAATGTGSTCSVNTTANAVIPNSVIERMRAVWELGTVDVYDGGADGDAETTADNQLFQTQGVFVP